MKNEKGSVEVSFSVSPQEALPHLKKAAARLAKNTLVPGFRKGKAPYAVLQRQIEESAILENALEDIIGKQVEQFLAQEKMSVVGRPRVDIEKLAPGNPIACKALFDLTPSVTLPDLSSLLIVRKKIEVSDEDVLKTLEDIRSRHPQKARSNGLAREGDNTSADDAFARELNPKFQNMEEYKANLKQSLLRELEYHDDAAKTSEMIDLLLKNLKLSHTPVLLVDQYADDMIRRFERDIAEREKTTLAEHLQHTGKPREDFDQEIRKEALKHVQTELILDEVIKAHGIEVSEEDVLREVEKIRLKFIFARMDVPRGVSSQAYRSHIKTTVLRNRALEFLKKKIIAYEKA